ncbi:MAG: hypothetical protein K2N85_04935 [Lachnospiraceae bacterium]|nr:hypothetical protein [Lachnospiraceae bacterium]
MDHLKCWLSDLFNVIESDEQSQNYIELLKKCGGNCAKRNLLPYVNGLKEELDGKSDMSNIAEIISRHTGAECIPAANGFILTYNRGKGCDCALVNGEYVTSPVFCNCTLGFHETVWSTMFEKTVSVELLETFLRGGNCCSQKITFL